MGTAAGATLTRDPEKIATSTVRGLPNNGIRRNPLYYQRRVDTALNTSVKI